MSNGGPPEARDFGDPTRRTYFAEERTLLAWWRSGLTALAVALGVGRLVPAVTTGSNVPYVVLGMGYALLGLLFIAYGSVRQMSVDRALAEGRFARVDRRVLIALIALLLLLTAGTMALLVADA